MLACDSILNEQPNKTKQNKTKQNKTKQNKTKQNKTKQNKTKQNKTKQNKTKQNKTKPLQRLVYINRVMRKYIRITISITIMLYVS